MKGRLFSSNLDVKDSHITQLHRRYHQKKFSSNRWHNLRPFVCLKWFDLRNHSIEPNDSLLEGKDRCPNLNEKSGEQFAFRFVLYLVIFITNVMLVNILIGQISKTLERVMKDDEKDYHMNVLQLKAGFNIGNVCGV